MIEETYDLKPTTRVLYYLYERKEFLVTNEEGEPEQGLTVFACDQDGNITMAGCELASVFAHNPYLLFELIDVDRPFGEVNPGYFGRRSA